MAHSPECKPALTMHQLREIASRISASDLADELSVALPVLDDALTSIAASVAAAGAKSRRPD
ncbi:Uncharacterised protein [Mycobacteroides abscessus]|uniref:Uncharacterized protein n=3 Tax=Mycobacteroides abscessus TaxID=36809 RepID=A0AB74FES6_9MYCO|nr:hypothetical protein [Mycobacteroides abscessus]MBN7339767.1 hypothetical protein [Mycobacteroides abscessus subsp. massiliense]MBN7397540.1 hypothetical protein [Mycobacteroides abscessus subsp. abscessus]MBN7541830.1 hypothetical protein [Mycobacteroides abscessus subsp. massiliense]MDB2305351.1 hypothetical protein [Mycobacteroides abscessus subsp. massiliense]MDM2386825.1 hypothetical protein [Mycobacteroides abscessus]